MDAVMEKARALGTPGLVPNCCGLRETGSDNSEIPTLLQVRALTRRCAITTTMAAILAPFAFGEARL